MFVSLNPGDIVRWNVDACVSNNGGQVIIDYFDLAEIHTVEYLVGLVMLRLPNGSILPWVEKHCVLKVLDVMQVMAPVEIV